MRLVVRRRNQLVELVVSFPVADGASDESSVELTVDDELFTVVVLWNCDDS